MTYANYVETPDLTIIIVNYNTRELILGCLRSIFAGPDSQRGYEVIVVDNASVDGSQEAITRDFSDVRVIANSKNLGFAAANNQGLKIAHGRYVLLLNSDTLLPSATLAEMIKFMDCNPQVGAAGPKLRYPDGAFQPSAYVHTHKPLTAFWGALWLDKLFPDLGMGLILREEDADQARPIAWVMGAFLIIRRSILSQVGLLDERYFMYCEEEDLCIRIRQEGYPVYYVPEVECVHIVGASWELDHQEPDQDAARYLLMLHARRLLMRKHFGWTGVALDWLGMLLISIGGSLRWSLTLLTRRDSARDAALRRTQKYIETFRWLFLGGASMASANQSEAS